MDADVRICSRRVFGVGIRMDMERDAMRTTTYTINEVLSHTMHFHLSYVQSDSPSMLTLFFIL